MKHLVLMVLMALLASCVFLKEIEYYAPMDLSEIRVVRSTRGAHEIAIYSLANQVGINIIVLGGKESSVVRFSFALPEGSSILLIDKNFTIKAYDERKVYLAEIDRIRGNIVSNGIGSFRYFHVNEQLTGGTNMITTPLGKTVEVHRSFEAEALVPNSLPAKFELKLPSFRLNGTLYERKAIMYERRRGVFSEARPW